jgi:hypothetical protein
MTVIPSTRWTVTIASDHPRQRDRLADAKRHYVAT